MRAYARAMGWEHWGKGPKAGWHEQAAVVVQAWGRGYLARFVGEVPARPTLLDLLMEHTDGSSDDSD